MGFPGRTVDVPGAAPSPELAGLVRAIRVDPFGQRDALAAMLSGDAQPTSEPSTGHLCATAWVVDADGDAVLLVRHRVLGWATPGGHLDVGEAPAHAAVRELREETGLDLSPASHQLVPDVLHAAVFPEDASGPPHWHYTLGYRFVADRTAPLLPEAGAPVRWFPVDRLPAPAVPDVAVVLPLLLRNW
jgi:8-oxo-dGTP pyrophosphatase MutT (NUDIX family)